MGMGSKVGNFGTLSGIRGAGNDYRNSIRKNQLQKAEQANERLRSNDKTNSIASPRNNIEQKNTQGINNNLPSLKEKVKVTKSLGNFRDKDSHNAGMKYLVSVKQSKLEDEPISDDDDEEDDFMDNDYLI